MNNNNVWVAKDNATKRLWNYHEDLSHLRQFWRTDQTTYIKMTEKEALRSGVKMLNMHRQTSNMDTPKQKESDRRYEHKLMSKDEA